MTTFETNQAAAAADLAGAFGASRTWTSPAGDDAAATTILGPERAAERLVDGGVVQVRQRTATVLASQARPGMNWTVVDGEGETWTAVAIEHYDGTWIRLLVERPEQAEFSRDGYRRRYR
jgi:hypothetical protein